MKTPKAQGPVPTGIVAITLSVAVLITDTVSENSFGDLFSDTAYWIRGCWRGGASAGPNPGAGSAARRT
jgi:hypothetical protein